MPTFATIGPIDLSIDVPVVNLHLRASDRADTVVSVRPTDPEHAGSVRAAESVQVSHEASRITITGTASWKQYVLPFAAGTAEITVELPSASSVHGRCGTLFAEGDLGTVRLHLVAGDVRLDGVDTLDLKVSAGSVTVGRVDGSVSIRAGAGSVRVGSLHGTGTLRATNGSVTVEEVVGAVELLGANGDLVVGRLDGELVARSSHAGIRLGRIDQGSATLATSFGSLEIGVPDGTAALVDLATDSGTVRNLLTPADGPGEGESTARIQARTRFGDIVVARP